MADGDYFLKVKKGGTRIDTNNTALGLSRDYQKNLEK